MDDFKKGTALEAENAALKEEIHTQNVQIGKMLDLMKQTAENLAKSKAQIAQMKDERERVVRAKAVYLALLEFRQAPETREWTQEAFDVLNYVMNGTKLNWGQPSLMRLIADLEAEPTPTTDTESK